MLSVDTNNHHQLATSLTPFSRYRERDSAQLIQNPGSDEGQARMTVLTVRSLCHAILYSLLLFGILHPGPVIFDAELFGVG